MWAVYLDINVELISQAQRIQELWGPGTSNKTLKESLKGQPEFAVESKSLQRSSNGMMLGEAVGTELQQGSQKGREHSNMPYPLKKATKHEAERSHMGGNQ